jgi:hypothetical protein
VLSIATEALAGHVLPPKAEDAVVAHVRGRMTAFAPDRLSVSARSGHTGKWQIAVVRACYERAVVVG